MTTFIRRNYLVLFTLALTAVLATACGDDPVVEEPDPADSIVTMKLLIGTSTVTISKVTGGATGSPVVIGSGATTVSVSFQDAAGNTVTGLDEFEARITSSNTAVSTYASTGKFTGTLNKVSAGSTQLTVGLWHVAEGHYDFGPYNNIITVNVQ